MICAGPGQAGARRVTRVSSLTSLSLSSLSLSLSPFSLWDDDPHLSRPVLYGMMLYLVLAVVVVVLTEDRGFSQMTWPAARPQLYQTAGRLYGCKTQENYRV